MKEDVITRNMLRLIRESSDKKEIPLPKNEIFGDTVKALEDCVKKQMQGLQIKFAENSVYFYPDDEDIIMTFIIMDLNKMVVNFKLNDSTGQGCYITCENVQMTDENAKNLQKIKYAFDAWKENLIQDSSIISNIKSSLLEK